MSRKIAVTTSVTGGLRGGKTGRQTVDRSYHLASAASRRILLIHSNGQTVALRNLAAAACDGQNDPAESDGLPAERRSGWIRRYVNWP
ncbi:hypothetical protein [Arthrobacter sp. B2a2-09]|uniref:hypothetical protein n=1 Tax=Arthrobacter sp. B2a2-09 TaxID=2952822 RepID=UPI0022CD8328|nr:hypothetical protein [Arthrobacter sp. B2a2-09]